MKYRFTKREITMIILLISIALIYTYFHEYLGPIENNNLELKLAIQRNELYISSHKEKETSTKQRYKQNTSKNAVPNKLIKNNTSNAVLLPNIEKNSEIAYNIMIAAQKNGIQLKRVEASEKEAYGDLQAVSFVTFIADFSSTANRLIGFVKTIESQNRLCEITSINLLSSDVTLKSEEEPIERLQVTIRYFFTGVD